ncbi:MAG: recombinase family protein [archaeon]
MIANIQKGIVYCRVSSQEQTKGTSLDGQEKACLDYAENKGINIVKIFIEKGESATAANRTELIKALDFCKTNKDIAAFVVWKIDRFARNTVDHYGLRAQLMKYGTRLHSVTEPISDDPIGKMTEAMLAGYAQFENDIRKQRCEGGMQRKLAEGIWCWLPPIGYIHAKKMTDRRKTRPDEPDTERFYLIQKGLNTYATGNYNITKLTELTNKWGLRTRTGKPMFKQLWENMLKNKFYAGILVNPWTGEEYQGQHKPMITLEEYNKIQFVKKGLSNNATIARLRLHPDFPLRSFISCACGQKLTASWRSGRSKKYPYYHCNNRNCQHYTHGIKKKELEDKFIDLLKKITPGEKFLKLFNATVVDTLKNQHTALEQEKNHYEQELNRLESKKTKLIQMRINGEISEEEFLKLKGNLDNQTIGIQISRNESKIDECNVETAISYTIQFIGNLARQWQGIKEVKQKQRLQALVFPNGVTYDKISDRLWHRNLSPIFKLNEDFNDQKSDFVAEIRHNLHQVIRDIKQIASLMQEINSINVSTTSL